MPLWLQHSLVLALVAGCVAVVAWQSFQTLRGKKSVVGKCCTKGCPPATGEPKADQRVHFLPVEMLRKRR
jgi:hypothetical protein